MADSFLLSDERLKPHHNDHDRTPPNASGKFEPDSHHRQRPTSYARWFEDWWLVELVAVICSCALVVALCVILKKYDGEQVPSFGTWFNSGITLGTLVALLTTLAVAMAMSTVQECISQLKWLWYSGASRPLGDIETYDRASRGLVGSVQLLWKLRLYPTASFGALLTIIHLAIAPLAQQSLLSVSEPVVVAGFDATATIPATKDWTETTQQTLVNMDYRYASLSAGMKGAIFNGFFASADVTINDTLPICTTGNCTFPNYQSLALCASSFDVTQHLQNFTTQDGTRWCLPGGFCAATNSSTIGNRLMVNITSAVTQAAKMADADAAKLERSSKRLNYTSLAFGDHVAPVGDFYIIYTNWTHTGVQATSKTPWAAVEFVLDWCVPTFTTQMINGIATTSRRSNPSTAFESGPYESSSVTIRTGGKEFRIHPDTHNTLQRYLNMSLSGSASMVQEFSKADSDQVQKLVNIFGIGGQGIEYHTTRADGLAALDAMLANTATSMTNYIRSVPNVEFVYGTAYVQQNVVRVHWGWIAAPIAFCVASLLFFFTVVALCSFGRSAKPPLWKSSAVAALRCFDPALHRELGGSSPGRISLVGVAGEQHVRLLRDGDGWLLVRGTSAKSNTSI